MGKNLLLVDTSVNCLTLTSLLRNERSLKVIGACNNLQNAQEKIRTLRPDYMVLDPQIMSPKDLDQLQKTAQQYHVKTLIFSQNKMPSFVGITQFVTKPKHLDRNFPIETLIQALIPGGTEGNAPSAFSARKAASSRENMFTTTAKKSSAIRVMLVDDAALMKVVINNLLATDSQMKMVSQASNGQEAIDKLNNCSPDIILLDIEMPVMDGLTFLEKARHLTPAKIIVLSSVASQHAQKAKMLGADGIIDKPSGAVSMDLAEKSGGQLLQMIHSLAATRHYS